MSETQKRPDWPVLAGLVLLVGLFPLGLDVGGPFIHSGIYWEAMRAGGGESYMVLTTRNPPNGLGGNSPYSEVSCSTRRLSAAEGNPCFASSNGVMGTASSVGVTGSGSYLLA